MRVEQGTPVGVEAGRLGPLELAELFAVGVRVEYRESRLRRAQRQLLAPKRHACCEDRVLERVLLLCELGREHSALARLAQAIQPFPLLALCRALGLVQRLDLPARQEVAVPLHDRGLLGDLLLADTNGPPLFGALEVVLLQTRLVVGCAQDCCC